MQIKDIFQYRIDREITSVIKVDDLKEPQMAQELREYVVTDRIERHLVDFLEPYVETRKGRPGAETDKIGVWISGFFGSGKSHLAKVISYLLTNPIVEGQEAVDIFLSRVATSPRELELKGLLTQVRNFFDNRVIVFQIKAEQDLINPDSISEIMYRQYLASRNLSRDPWVGRLELGLIQQGVMDAFQAEIEKLERAPWEEVRQDYLIVRSSMVRALRTVMPDRYPTDADADKALDDLRAGLRIGPADLARELAAYVNAEDVKTGERSVHVVYVIDEMGQFIGDDGQKLLELQSIAEQFGTEGQGKLWLIVTAQEALEDIIAGVRRRRADYAKIIDRFDIQLELTSENIEKVLEERILKKRQTALDELQAMFDRNQGNIVNVGSLLDANRRLPIPDRDLFGRTYPFLPYHFDLMQNAFANLRAKGGQAIQLTGGERSMLGVVQALLKSPQTGFATDHTGRLVALDEIFDQILTEVSGSDRRSINGVPGRVEAGAFPPIRALKAVFILNQVDWIPRTLDNIARLLAPHVETDLPKLREEIRDALTRLKRASYVTEVDEQYKYLSAAERGIEEEIASEPVKNNDIRREARVILRNLLANVGRLNYESGVNIFDIRVRGDGEEIRSVGDITLEVYSPIAADFDTLDPTYVRDELSPVEERSVYWLPGEVTDLAPDFSRLIRVEAVVKRRKGRAEQSVEEVVILREKEQEAELLRSRLQSGISRALIHGLMIYGGDETRLDGKTTNLNTIFNRELAKVIPHVYTKFHLAAVKVNEKSIKDMLTIRPASLPNVEPDLHLWDEQQHINAFAPAVQPVLEELGRRSEYGLVADGKSLAAHFSAVPFGWNPILLRIVLAALFRAGTISVQVGGKYYTDPGTQAAQNALVRSSDFNKAVFEYAEEGLSLDERRKARQRIDILFERKVDDTTNTLARTLQDEMSNLQQQNERLRLQAQGGNLPVKDILFEGKPLLDSILDQPKPDQIVKGFLAKYDDVVDLKDYQDRLEAFIGAGNLAVYGKVSVLLDAIAKAREVVPALADKKVLKRLTDLRAIAHDRAVVEKWKDVVPMYQRLLSACQAAYTELFDQRNAVYAEAKEQVAQFGMVPAAITDCIVEDPGGWAEDGLTYARDRSSLVDLYYQVQMVEQRRVEAIQRLQAEKKPKKKVKGKKTVGEGYAPVFVKVTDYLAGEYTSGDTFDTDVDRLAKRVKSELDAKRKVVLG
jgi:hypothetical protein